ncbi:carbon storage regulator CsrA [Gorillibacterium timonense]|uniref:carbon storage regulator CsrA n=1 Tax=Gorillibacterium timonense TaxID=1689269 RepID=UPI00071DF0F2|nr:carbon storage regulator CsrA [Gorillibacterium timonense]
MLVLARKKGESIVIGDNIEIVVLDTEGDSVRLGISAPKEVQIHRQEIYKAIRLSNEEASKSAMHIKSLADLLKNGEQ